MELHSKTKGALGELVVMKDLISKGYPVFTEYGDNSRVDLIVLVDSRAIKIQVKAIKSLNGAVKLLTYKSGPNYRFTYSGKDFDVMAVYVLDKDKVLYVGVYELLANSRAFCIRLDMSKNNQQKRTRMYTDFESFEEALKTW